MGGWVSRAGRAGRTGRPKINHMPLLHTPAGPCPPRLMGSITQSKRCSLCHHNGGLMVPTDMVLFNTMAAWLNLTLDLCRSQTKVGTIQPSRLNPVDSEHTNYALPG